MGPIEWFRYLIDRLQRAVQRIHRWLGILLLVVVGLLAATLVAAGVMIWIAVVVCQAAWCTVLFGIGAVVAIVTVVIVAPLAWFLATRWFMVRVARRRTRHA